MPVEAYILCLLAKFPNIDGKLCGSDHLEARIVGSWAISKTGVVYGKSTRRVVWRRCAQNYASSGSILLRPRGLGILQRGKAVKGSPD